MPNYVQEATVRHGEFLQHVVKVDFAAGASLSPAIDLGALRITAIQFPAGWEGSDVSFQASADGATFEDLYNQYGNEVFCKAGQRYVALDPATFASVRWLKIRSGLSGSEVPQSAARTLLVIGRIV